MNIIQRFRNAYEKGKYTKQANKIDDLMEIFFNAFLMAAIAVNLVLLSELVKTLELIFKGLEVKGVI